MLDPAVTSSSYASMWAALTDVGRHAGTGGYRRYAWTRADAVLREWFAGECVSRGLDLVEDRVGNQWAWWGDPDSAPGEGVVTGSHLDSVPDGGAYDGPLGVVSAFAAIDRLRDRGFQPGRPLGVVCFVDEEGARFGVACSGSRVLTGALTADRALGLTDGDGVAMADALRTAGRRPEHVGPDPETLGRVGTFVELHVEQGRGLVDLGQPVAIGTDIWPHGRWRLDFAGEANHAGTTRLEDRHDALLGLATAVLAARSAAAARGCLATVGKVRVDPGAVNAVAAAATGWLDARGADEAEVRAVVAEVTAAVSASAGTITQESWTPTTAFTPTLVDRLRAVLPDAPGFGTGAGHDAGVLAAAGVASAMVFVRNPTGVSHSPAEHADPVDCLAGVEALASVLADLSGASA